jgi:hypothetical protein
MTRLLDIATGAVCNCRMPPFWTKKSATVVTRLILRLLNIVTNADCYCRKNQGAVMQVKYNTPVSGCA